MPSHRRLAAVASLLVLAATSRAQGQSCNLNPSGPDELVLTVPTAGSDFDLGWTGEYHDLEVPGGARFELCLENCDETADPVCDVAGYAGGQSAVGRSFAPPIPVIAGSVAACIVTSFREPFATGTADVQTGAIAVTATISADVYLTSKAAVCPECSGGVAGATGTCSGGANQGRPCTTGEVVVVEGATGDSSYAVSRDCPPAGGPIPVQFTVQVGTGSFSVAGRCPGQTRADACPGAGTCTAACTGAGRGGVSQTCCSTEPSRRCFPDPVARIGTAAAPQPAWPDPTWPKVGDAEIASVFCAPAAPGLVGLAVNADVGLPGPAAFILPVRAEWQLDPTPLPTTTTTTLPPSGCTSAADCPDTDGCTVDACDAGRCTNTPLSGAAAATCRFLAFSAADLCPGLDTKLGGAVAKLVDRARAAVDAVAGAKAKKATKLRRRASAALAMVLRKVGKAEKKGAIEGGCAGALRDGVGRLQQSVAAIGG